MRLKEKVALVTGANKGIGLEIARQLGRLGCTVLIGARDEQRGEDAAKQLQTEGLDARFVRLDVTDHRARGAVRLDLQLGIDDFAREPLDVAHHVRAGAGQPDVSGVDPDLVEQP